MGVMLILGLSRHLLLPGRASVMVVMCWLLLLLLLLLVVVSSRSLGRDDDGVTGVQVWHGRGASHVGLVLVVVGHRHQLMGCPYLGFSLKYFNIRLD